MGGAYIMCDDFQGCVCCARLIHGKAENHCIYRKKLKASFQFPHTSV